MRELTKTEMESVEGGNPLVGLAAGVSAVVGAYTGGKYIGSLVNDYNATSSSMSFGEAIYRTVHSIRRD